MRFTFNIKPTILKGHGTTYHARIAFREYLGNEYFISSLTKNNNGQYYGYHAYVDRWCIDPEYVYAYNIEVFKRGKHRGKYKHFDLYIYRIPVKLLKMLNLYVNQGDSTFKIQKYK